jgi:transcriptional regulator with XRE-family HTH domain
MGMLDKELHINTLIGNNIRAQRKAHDVSADDLAQHMGISAEQLQRIETGEDCVSAAHLKLICEHLDISPMALHPAIEYT